jgi:aminopeptidase N
LLGPELFRKGTDLYFSRHDGQAVTTEDFIQAMADVSGRDFSRFFHWYRQSGTPRLQVRGEYDPQQKNFTLTVKQSCPPTPGQPHKELFHLPLAMGLIDKAGRDVPSIGGTKILEIHDAEQDFVFSGISQKPVPSLLRNFSAPVKLDYPYTLEELALLMKHDSDIVARWEASQQFAVKHLLDWVTALQNRRQLQQSTLWRDTFSQLLADKNGDLHLLARLLTLPAESYLAQFLEPVDVENIHQAREFGRQQLANGLEKQFLDVYHHFQDRSPYVFNTAAMGRRSVKNLALAYLVNTGKETYANLAVEQFKTSDNMTDAMGALWALNNYEGVQRQQILESFYKKWQDQPLVVNKWLALQASSQLPDTLQQVEKLLKHPAFSINNPNNVYNLIGVFAGNTVHFHAKDGSGYQFVADRVIEIDPKNPQVAARMVEALTRWQRFDKNRQQLMRAQLQRVQANPQISNDVYELVTKSLQ